MDSIPENEILEFPEDALQAVRKEYDLDKPGRMDQAIDLLDAWVKKQNHFTRKDFPRDYFERQIIFSKGSVEQTKQKLERNCTFKNLVPFVYETINFKTDYKDSSIFLDAVLPKLTEDYCRIYVLKNIGERFINGLTDYFRFILSMAEYVVSHNYTKGILVVVDYTDTNLFDLTKVLDIVEFRQAINTLIEGYGMKIKGERIQVHKNYESLHTFLSKDVLPAELGGYEKSLSELHELWLDILSSEDHLEYFKERKSFKTNEKFRQTDKLNEEYMGMSGTFRTLSVD